MAHEDKIYLVTRADLSPGYQATQAAHALADLLIAEPVRASQWAETSNSLIALAAKSEADLHALEVKARALGLTYQAFREPDLCDELTAIALSPSQANRRMLSNLPLAGKPHTDPTALLDRERRLRELARKMENCEQAPGQDVLAHGRSVRAHYRAILEHLRGEVDLNEYVNWRLLDWLTAYGPQLLAAQASYAKVDRYLTIHDAGKPDVLTVDDEGRRHFPHHPAQSQQTYLDVYAETADPDVAHLIRHDSDIHQLKAAGVAEFADQHLAATHLLAGLAEVTSNAAMFGGLDSTSFKIKFKALSSRGNALCKLWFDQHPDN